MGKETKPAARNERMVSLLLFFADRRRRATRAVIEENVEGYAGLASGDESAMKRFDRDVRALGDIGIHVDADSAGGYLLDMDRGFSRQMDLPPTQLAMVHLAGLAAASDPDFAYGPELSSALTKIDAALQEDGGTPQVHPRLTGNPPADASILNSIRVIDECIARRKRISCPYTNAQGYTSAHVLEPLGRFQWDGADYLLAVNASSSDPERPIHQYRMDRLENPVPAGGGRKPDFDARPIDLHDYIDFPFAFGNEAPFEVTFLIPRDARRTPEYLWSGKCVLQDAPGLPDMLLMKAMARSARATAAWAVEFAEGTAVVEPGAARRVFVEQLGEEGGARG